MSRTLHHNKLQQLFSRPKRMAKKKYLKAFAVEDWYIELPLSSKLSKKSKLFARKDQAWN